MPPDDRRCLSPPQYASQLHVKPETVISWILRGELAALNIARPGATRPRYRLTPAAIEAFELRRAVVTTPKQIRRRRSPEAVPQYV